MSSPDKLLCAAYEQGYMRAAYKMMDIVHAALRNQWTPDRLEEKLRRAASQAVREGEMHNFAMLQRGTKKHVIHP